MSRAERENRMKRKKTKHDRGFTLIELIIVVAIMAILAIFLVPSFLKHIEKSRVASDIENAQRMGRAMEAWVADAKAEGKLTGDGNPYEGYLAKFYVFVGGSADDNEYYSEEYSKNLNSRLGAADGQLVQTKVKVPLKSKPDGEKYNYTFAVFVEDTTHIKVYAVYKDSDTTNAKVTDKYELYPEVEKGSPWDVEDN